MKITCECGHQFDVEDGVARAKCPRCGREAEAKRAGDWLASVDVEDMSLEAEAPAPEAEQPAQPGGGAPEEAGEFELEQPGVAPAPPAARPGPSAPTRERGERTPTDKQVEELPAEPRLLDILKRVLERPEDGLPYFEDGIRSRRFITETAVVVVGLALIGAGLLQYLAAPASFSVGGALTRWFSIVCELVCATVVFSLLCIAFKRGPKPLGVGEGLAVVRIAALLVTVALSLIALVLVIVTQRGETPRAIAWVAMNLSTVYWLTLFVGQTMLIMSMVKLGCMGAVIVSVVLTYGGYAMAERLLGFL